MSNCTENRFLPLGDHLLRTNIGSLHIQVNRAVND